MKILNSILFMFIFSLAIYSQPVSGWKTLTNMSTVYALSVSSDEIWAATSGGAFLYKGGLYKTLTRSDGLTGSSLTAIAEDKYGKIWLGSSSGVIDVYNPSNNSFNTILDIFNSGKTSKQINEIIPSGDTVIVSTDFGISLIDVNRFVFYDTFFRFGSLSSNIRVNSTLKTDLLYGATDFGVAIQKQGANNLSAPESWNVFTINDGLPSSRINKVINYKGEIIAATDNGLSVYNGTVWASFLPDLNNSDILDLATDGDSLFILAQNIIYSYNNGITKVRYQGTTTISKLSYSPASGLYAGSNNGVLKIENDGSSENYAPNGPIANQFPELTVDKDGALWSASGTDQSGVGFYEYMSGIWTNFSKSNYPQLPTNFYHTAYTAPDNSKYFGNWGNGFARVKNNVISVFTTENTGMVGIDNSPEFLVISHFGVDSKNNLWVLNYWAGDKKTLNMLSPDSIWYHFTVPAENNLSLEGKYYLNIDQYDTKWYACKDKHGAGRAGVFYFNENKTITNPNDDKSGFINSSNGLNEDNVNALVIDKRGDIWVGTSLGVNVISNTETIVSQVTPELRISSVFSLRQQTINCIAVDPLNQKWVGTNQGLILVNSDGSYLLTSFNSKNSPLPSDVIRSIAIDSKSGTVYVGTDEGLTSFKTLALEPQDSFTELFIYPSPFILKGSDNILTIDGLVKDCDIKILSSSGKLINQFGADVISGQSVSPGGYRALWNGRDQEGNLVSSGIYFIVAFDKEGNNVSTGKVAILKE